MADGVAGGGLLDAGKAARVAAWVRAAIEGRQAGRSPAAARIWKLDNAGIVMPAVADGVNTSYFRFTALLRGEVDRRRLQAAIDRLTPRLPHVFVALRPGWSEYRLESLARPPLVEDDELCPCLGLDLRAPGTPLLRIRVAGRRIAFEMSHAIADGHGSLRVFMAILDQYAGEGSPDPEATEDGTIIRPGQAIDSEEFEDSYHRYWLPRIPWPAARPRAFRIGVPRLPADRYRVTELSLDLAQSLAKAKSLGASLTEYLAATYLAVLQDLRSRLEGRHSGRAGKVLALMVPVNLRRLLPSRTLRNFSLFVLPSIPVEGSELPFGEILARARSSMRAEAAPGELLRMVSRNVFGQKVLPVRFLPRILADSVLKFVYEALGEGMLTSHLSNIGAINLSPRVAALVERLDFVPGASRNSGTNAGVMSYGGRLAINFGSTLVASIVEEAFTARLRADGLEASVAVNLPG